MAVMPDRIDLDSGKVTSRQVKKLYEEHKKHWTETPKRAEFRAVL